MKLVTTGTLVCWAFIVCRAFCFICYSIYFWLYLFRFWLWIDRLFDNWIWRKRNVEGGVLRIAFWVFVYGFCYLCICIWRVIVTRLRQHVSRMLLTNMDYVWLNALGLRVFGFDRIWEMVCLYMFSSIFVFKQNMRDQTDLLQIGLIKSRFRISIIKLESLILAQNERWRQA